MVEKSIFVRELFIEFNSGQKLGISTGRIFDKELLNSISRTLSECGEKINILERKCDDKNVEVSLCKTSQFCLSRFETKVQIFQKMGNICK